MFFILGVIVGVLVSLIVITISLRFQSEIKRTVELSGSRLKTKGRILDPEDEGLENWVENLPKE